MISERMVRQKIQEDIFGNYLMNYLTEFDSHKDIVLIVYIFYAKIFFF